jgi:phage terminase Nu1 subunit (DNA packaging protein)
MTDAANIVTTRELADWLAVNESTVREYSARGLITPLQRGRYPLRESVSAVISHLRAVASQHRPAGESDDDNRDDLTQQRARLAHAQRLKIEREEQVAMGLLLDAKEAQAAWYEEMRAVRDALMNIPDRVAPQLVGIDTLHAVRQLLLTEITEICHSLAE